MTWPPHDPSRELTVDALGDLAPEEVLYEFDGPCIFTARAPSQALLLAYLVEEIEDESLLRYLVTTTSPSTVRELREGLIPIRRALTRGSMWIADLSFSLAPQRIFAIAADELPEDVLPADAAMLLASLEPALRVRLEGPEITHGNIPSAVITQASEIAGKALKPIVDWLARGLRADASGRPPDSLRRLYSLPTQGWQPGSLDIYFRAPELPKAAAQGTLPMILAEGPTPEEILEGGWELLRRGLEWATSDHDEPLGSSDEEQLAVLEALRHLAPSSTGPVIHVSISGAKISGGGRHYDLDRAASKKIRRQLTDLKKHQDIRLRVFSGRIREADLDRLSFILRDVPGEDGEFAFVFEDDRFLEIVREAWTQELVVEVAGSSPDSKVWAVSELEFVREPDRPGSTS